MVGLIQVKSALVSTVLMAVLGLATYILGVGDVFALDFHTLVNVGAVSLLTGIVSLVKALLSNEEGDFLGVVKIK